MIRLVGLGPGGASSMSVAAAEALRAGGLALLRTGRHPAADDLRKAGLAFSACDDLYDTLEDFDAVYDAIADRVIAAARDGDVAYAVPGDPMVGEESVWRIIARAQAEGLEYCVIGSASFVEPALAAAGVVLDAALLIVDALSIEQIRPAANLPMLIYQVYDREVASRVKLALLADMPDDFEVTVIRQACVAGAESVLKLPLHRLDRVEPDHLTSVYVPALPTDQRRKTFADLVEVMRRLRAEDGCPWDRAQTHETLRKWLIEECYEAIEAIDRGDMEGLCEELGDVLLQIVFHAQMASEAGAFTADDVAERIVEKLIRRHPHVFGHAEAKDPATVERNWNAIKKAERKGRTSALDGVPSSLPALHRAAELGRRAAAVGFDWEREEDVLAKVAEELQEVRDSLEAGETDHVRHEIGDLLFAITNLARWRGIDPEEALREMLARFVRRFQAIEAEAGNTGRDLRAMTLAEMDDAWNRAKREES